jgi:hypothetical protein
MEAEKGSGGGTFLVEDVYDTRLSGFVRGGLSRGPGDFADHVRGAAAPGVWAGIH